MSAGAESLIEVVAAILWMDGRFLAVERPEGKAMAGLWEFPGGKIEPGETAEAALVRELLEELGVKARKFAFWKEKTHAYPALRVRLLFFHIHEFSGTPSPLEGQRMSWLSPGEAHVLPFLEADQDIVRALATYAHA